MSEIHIVRACDLKKLTRLSTGCKELDEFLRGGLPIQGITEISGESGSGKSQLCMQLCLTVQYNEALGGLNGSAVYICTEERFQSRRLQQMIDNFPKRNNEEINFGSHIYIEHVGDFSSLKQSLTTRVPVLIQKMGVKLLVLDSIAGIFRGTYENSEAHKRTLDLRCIGSLLHKLCYEFGAMIVCVNQVCDLQDVPESIPALGLAWANMVTSRFQLFKCPNGARQFSTLFSPQLPNGTCYFAIDDCGIVDVASL